MNTVIIGEKIMDVAGSIAGRLKPQAGELANTAANMFRDSQKYQNIVAKEALNTMLTTRAKISEEAAGDILSKMRGKTADEAIDSVAEQVKEATSSAEALLNRAKKDAAKKLEGASTEKILMDVGPVSKYSAYPQAYFNSPDKKVNHTRIGAAVGAYAAATVGGRYLSGGTLTTDGYGKKDIAGIPFL